MKISSIMWQKAVAQQIITENQATQLQLFFQQLSENSQSFRFIHFFYYLGGMIAITAMSLFLNFGFNSFGSQVALVITLAYLIIAWAAGHFYFWQKGWSTPAGILFTFVIVLVPLSSYFLIDCLGIKFDFSEYHDFFTYVNNVWLYLELPALLVGIVLFAYYRIPFMLMPIAFILWFMGMDLYLVAGVAEHFSGEQFSCLWGIIVLIFAFVVDKKQLKQNKDFAFWLYLFGLMSFWGGLSLMGSGTVIGKLIYGMINLLLMLASVYLRRLTFMVFGSIGLFLDLGYFAFDYFQDVFLFSILMCLFGLGLIALASCWWHKRFIVATKD